MAIVVTTKGTAANDKSDQDVLFPDMSGWSAGNSVIVIVSSDNPIDIVSFTAFPRPFDKDVEAVNTGNIVVSVWSKHDISTAEAEYLNTSGGGRATNTYTMAKVLAIYQVTGLATSSTLDKTASATGSGTAGSSGATATLSQAAELIIGAVGAEDEIDDLDGVWTTGAGNVSGNEQQTGTNGAGDASNISVYAAAEVVAVTTAQTAEVTGMDSIDWAAAVATYKGAAVGPPAIIGTATVTVQPVTIAATGTYTPQAIIGTGGVTIQPVALSGSGKLAFKAIVALAVLVIALSGTGKQAFVGNSAFAVQPVQLSGTGVYTPLAITGTGTFAIEPIVLSGEGTVSTEGFTGEAAITVEPVALSGVGKQTFIGNNVFVTQPTSLVAEGKQIFTGSSTVTVEPISLTAEGKLTFVGDGTIDVESVVLSGVGVYTPLVITGTGTFIIESVTLSGEGTVSGNGENITGEGIITAQPVSISGEGATPFWTRRCNCARYL